MTGERLESLYNQIFERVYPEIKYEKRGVLYKVINIILETNESQAKEICNYLGIKENTHLDDDLKITDD